MKKESSIWKKIALFGGLGLISLLNGCDTLNPNCGDIRNYSSHIYSIDSHTDKVRLPKNMKKVSYVIYKPLSVFCPDFYQVELFRTDNKDNQKLVKTIYGNIIKNPGNDSMIDFVSISKAYSINDFEKMSDKQGELYFRRDGKPETPAVLDKAQEKLEYWEKFIFEFADEQRAKEEMKKIENALKGIQ